MKVEQTLKELVQVCKTHEMRLVYALEHIKNFLPITPESLDKMGPQDFVYLDAACNRFMQLQDTVGKKVFPRILKHVEEFESEESFLDRLGRLERLRVILSAETWEDLRDLRNELSHEYAILDKEEMSKNINDFIGATTRLIQVWQNVYTYLLDKKLV